ncbi:hypothetical protein NC653_026764 [Populus alba x Populus x berolinensis]|uniref:DUF4283 domain-containing protein n=1 Tax=Populus alba x Populus x berolinensis TaxID=444605 RepID=A0AAD6Q4C8_9ROSI|nr:hypothetical protein NC653_026764 [Populus alba x Populus x berolinensis]
MAQITPPMQPPSTSILPSPRLPVLSKPKHHTKKPTASTSQTSWADRVRVSDSSTRFTLDPLPRQPVGHCLKISEQILLENKDQWMRCMIGFIPGFKLPYHAVNTIATKAWRSCGLETVMTTANGFMIFRFKTEEEMHTVIEKGPWMFGGKNIILQQWHPRFQFDKSKISTLPVWIRLHGLPFPLWSKQGLSLAASMVGRPLSCDESTYTCTRLEYARLCVEVDANLPFVHSFDIDCPLSSEPIKVTVDYEWKPSHCDKCKPTSRTPTPATKSIPADHTSLQPQTNALSITDTIIPILPVMEVCDSSNDSGTDCHNFDSHHITVLNTTACIESKMDSLRTISESSSATIETTADTPSASLPTASAFVQSPSPSPSPKTVRKKKGGRKKKEARGH